MTNPLPDWYIEQYPHAIPPPVGKSYREEMHRAGATIYGPRLEYGAARVRGTTTPLLVNLGERLKLARQAEEEARALRAAPWLLRLELWWLRQRLRWTARPGFRLVVHVPIA